MGHTVEQKCCDSGTFWLYLVVIIGLLLFSGLMSGLTLGLMSLSMVDLEVIKKSGKPEDRRHAEKIVPVVRKQHLLLVTLLVGNAMAMEALPLFLDSLVDTWMAIVLSVTLLLMFGEILPQAVCSRYGLAVGAAMAPIVRLLLFIMFPIAWPVSKLLDKLLGDRDNGLFGRAELKTLVDMHSNEAGNGGNLSSHETRIIAGALELADKTARQAMTPIPAIVSVDVNSRLDDHAMMSILSSGYSRIPVYSGKPDNIIGLIVVKNLLNVTIEARCKLPVIDVPIRKIPWVPENMPLYHVLHQFQQGRSHMAAVVRAANSTSNLQDVKASASADHDVNCIAVDVHTDLEVDGRTDPEAHGFDHELSKPAVDCKNLEEVEESVKALNGSYSSNNNNNDNSNNNQDLDDDRKRYYRLVSWTDEEFKGNILGIITREDVLDELLKKEIPPGLESTDCTVEAVDQEFTKVSLRELQASLQKPMDGDHKNPSCTCAAPPAANCKSTPCYLHPNAAQVSRASAAPPRKLCPPTEDYHAAGSCVLTATPPTLKVLSPAKMLRNHVQQSSTCGQILHPQSIALESSDGAVSRTSLSGTTERTTAPSSIDLTESREAESVFQSRISMSSSAPSSSPRARLGLKVGSQSMTRRSTFPPRSRRPGISPFRNLISRACMHGGRESPITMSREIAVQRVFRNNE